ncbi:MAG TPA: Rne/Rng family ribonuclease [Mycobacteriales bacterium]|nr:Rne/Rng family ribonuclease [Mycobacteriales bacterium]
MLDDERNNDPSDTSSNTPTESASATKPPRPPSRRRTVSRPAGPPSATTPDVTAPSAAASTPAAASGSDDTATEAPPRARRSRKKAVAAESPAATPAEETPPAAEAADETPTAPPRRRRTAKATAAATTPDEPTTDAPAGEAATAAVPAVLFQPPSATAAPARTRRAAAAPAADAGDDTDQADDRAETGDETDGEDSPRSSRRRRGRRGRGGRPAGEPGSTDDDASEASADSADSPADAASDASDQSADAEDGDGEGDGHTTGGTSTGTRRRRRRRRGGGGGGATDDGSGDDPPNTVVHVREARKEDDGVRGVKGSTRIEAKRQRRRDGRDTHRRRPSIVTESEFLARRESVERVMVVRQGDDRTQIGVLEDGVLVEHYVTRKDSGSMVGNVYLGKVQNVLPSMEAAFVDIGRGRNAVLYAGEVNYDASALEGRPPRIEQALKSGQSVLVQVTKDPIGHKGSRLTSQVSLPGRYMVYVPDGRLSGISRKLPDTERARLKSILKQLTPDDAGLIVRTAAEGATEEALERDINRLKAQWEVIEKKAQTAPAPSLIYSEPDLVIRVIRDIFNEDFSALVVQGPDEWDTIDNYVRWVAPDLAERARRWTEDEDVFTAYRVDEQLAKALDRKVWLPSGGTLVIDRTEAMVVVDVNTGKFTGKGGNLEETVTKNNLEAAEEIVNQLRLRDLGGIIVIDFIDMVLESNRDLVLRRLMECLGRDRTRHNVAEVTSLGLVQMTRKRVGTGLLEAFSETCKTCGGSGVVLTIDPVAARRPPKPKPASARPHTPTPAAEDSTTTEDVSPPDAATADDSVLDPEAAATAASDGNDESKPATRAPRKRRPRKTAAVPATAGAGTDS